jgi:hypothetical protein
MGCISSFLLHDFQSEATLKRSSAILSTSKIYEEFRLPDSNQLDCVGLDDNRPFLVKVQQTLAQLCC